MIVDYLIIALILDRDMFVLLDFLLTGIVVKLVVDAGISVMPRTETKHPLDPLSAAEISVAVATVRAAGANPEVRKLTVFFFHLLITLIS